MAKFIVVLGLTVCVFSSTFAYNYDVIVECKSDLGDVYIKVNKKTLNYSFIEISNHPDGGKAYSSFDGKALSAHSSVTLSSGEIKSAYNRLNLVPGQKQVGFDIYLSQRRTKNHWEKWVAHGIPFDTSECKSNE